MEKYSPFSRKLRYERQRRGWSQAELASMLGSDHKSVSRWERGETFPTPKLRQKLTELLGKNLEELGFALETADERNGQTQSPSSTPPFLTREDWDEAPYVEKFHGRE